MSSSNGTGVIHIGRKGRKKFSFGEGPSFEVDVVKAWDEWADIDRSFRVPDPTDPKATIVPDDAFTSYRQARTAYVKQLSGVDDLSEAECLEFMAKVGDEVKDLRVFFQPRSASEPSSQESTKTVVFSQ